MLAVALTATLASCGDDNNDEPEGPKKITLKSGELNMMLCLSQNVIDNYDIFYTTTEGKDEKTTMLTADNFGNAVPDQVRVASNNAINRVFSVKATVKSLPIVLRYRIQLRLKSGLDAATHATMSYCLFATFSGNDNKVYSTVPAPQTDETTLEFFAPVRDSNFFNGHWQVNMMGMPSFVQNEYTSES